MMYEVEVSEQTKYDLRGIFEYIAFELRLSENSEGQFERLEEKILSPEFSFYDTLVSKKGGVGEYVNFL